MQTMEFPSTSSQYNMFAAMKSNTNNIGMDDDHQNHHQNKHEQMNIKNDMVFDGNNDDYNHVNNNEFEDDADEVCKVKLFDGITTEEFTLGASPIMTQPASTTATNTKRRPASTRRSTLDLVNTMFDLEDDDGSTKKDDANTPRIDAVLESSGMNNVGGVSMDELKIRRRAKRRSTLDLLASITALDAVDNGNDYVVKDALEDGQGGDEENPNVLKKRKGTRSNRARRRSTLDLLESFAGVADVNTQQQQEEESSSGNFSSNKFDEDNNMTITSVADNTNVVHDLSPSTSPEAIDQEMIDSHQAVTHHRMARRATLDLLKSVVDDLQCHEDNEAVSHGNMTTTGASSSSFTNTGSGDGVNDSSSLPIITPSSSNHSRKQMENFPLFNDMPQRHQTSRRATLDLLKSVVDNLEDQGDDEEFEDSDEQFFQLPSSSGMVLSSMEPLDYRNTQNTFGTTSAATNASSRTATQLPPPTMSSESVSKLIQNSALTTPIAAYLKTTTMIRPTTKTMREPRMNNCNYQGQQQMKQQKQQPQQALQLRNTITVNLENKTKLEIMMEKTLNSSKSLHEWDKRVMGLKKSHCKTMRLSLTSRKNVINALKKDRSNYKDKMLIKKKQVQHQQQMKRSNSK